MLQSYISECEFNIFEKVTNTNVHVLKFVFLRMFELLSSNDIFEYLILFTLYMYLKKRALKRLFTNSNKIPRTIIDTIIGLILPLNHS